MSGSAASSASRTVLKSPTMRAWLSSMAMRGKYGLCGTPTPTTTCAMTRPSRCVESGPYSTTPQASCSDGENGTHSDREASNGDQGGREHRQRTGEQQQVAGADEGGGHADPVADHQHDAEPHAPDRDATQQHDQRRRAGDHATSEPRGDQRLPSGAGRDIVMAVMAVMAGMAGGVRVIVGP